MGQPVIKETSLSALPALGKLFARAVDQHFTYIAEPVRAKVKRNHSFAQLLRARADRRRVLLTASYEGRIIGYAIGAAPKEGPAQLFWLYVEPEYRRFGVGRALLKAMVQTLISRGARTIAVATYDHRDFYAHQGFTFVRSTPIDGVKMDVLKYETQKR
jgi:GNAT superfamily N-acetyltransferase